LVSGLEEVDVPKAMEIVDPWENALRRQGFLRQYRFDYAFHVTRPWESHYEANCPDVRFVWTPNAVRTDIFRDYGLDKEIDLLFYGATFDWYPLRRRLRDLLDRLATSSALRVKILPHPGYCHEGYVPHDGHCVGESLAREINRSWITIATGSIHRCLFSKHLEIPASKSLAAGSMPDQARPFLGRGFVDLEGKNDDEIIEVFDRLLRNKDDLRARIEDGYRRVRAGFPVEGYAQELLDLVARLT
jgi:hypothetical protein